MAAAIRPEIMRALERLAQAGEREAAEAIGAFLNAFTVGTVGTADANWRAVFTEVK